jgi:DNA-binding PadR family transcriptional regulator
LTSFHSPITIVNIGHRKKTVKELEREILLGFWKAHILHHAGEQPLHGQWMILELRRHGYEISPGTLYPLLHRMERLGWLKGNSDPNGGKRARKDYRLTPRGRKVLEVVRENIKELHEEVVEGAQVKKNRKSKIPNAQIQSKRNR